jgi:hypothetical protein
MTMELTRWAGPGGEPMNQDQFKQDVLRAQMCEVVRNACIEHSTTVVDQLLLHFNVTKKPPTAKET